MRGLEESYNTLQSLTDWPGFAEGIDASVAPAVLEPLCDDLNTPKAIAELHALHREGNLAALEHNVIDRVLGEDTADRKPGMAGTNDDRRDAFDGESRRGCVAAI